MVTTEAAHTEIAWTPDAPGLLLAARLSVFLGALSALPPLSVPRLRELGALNPVHHRRATSTNSEPHPSCDRVAYENDAGVQRCFAMTLTV